MSEITREETFAARDIIEPVEVTYTEEPTGREVYLLRFGGKGVDYEFTHAEAKALRDALTMALASAEGDQ